MPAQAYHGSFRRDRPLWVAAASTFSGPSTSCRFFDVRSATGNFVFHRPRRPVETFLVCAGWSEPNTSAPCTSLSLGEASGLSGIPRSGWSSFMLQFPIVDAKGFLGASTAILQGKALSVLDRRLNLQPLTSNVVAHMPIIQLVTPILCAGASALNFCRRHHICSCRGSRNDEAVKPQLKARIPDDHLRSTPPVRVISAKQEKLRSCLPTGVGLERRGLWCSGVSEKVSPSSAPVRSSQTPTAGAFTVSENATCTLLIGPDEDGPLIQYINGISSIDATDKTGLATSSLAKRTSKISQKRQTLR